MKHGTEFNINGIRVDLANASIRDHLGRQIALRHQSFNVLRFLIENPDRLVTKDELMSAVWPQTAVTDDSLVQCIHEIRRALDDGDQTLVRTIQRRGYCLDIHGSAAGAKAFPPRLRIAAALNLGALAWGLAGGVMIAAIATEVHLSPNIAPARHHERTYAMTGSQDSLQKENRLVLDFRNPKYEDTIARALEYLNRDTENDTVTAIKLLESALKSFPDDGRVDAILAQAQISLLSNGWNTAMNSEQEELTKKIYNYISRAKRTHSPFINVPLAMWSHQKGDYKNGLEYAELALATAPRDPDFLVTRALLLTATGQAAQARESLEQLISESEIFRPKALRAMSMALLSEGKYLEATLTVERLLAQGAATRGDYLTLVSSLGHLERFADAAGAIDRFNQLSSLNALEPMTVQEAQWNWNGNLIGYHRPYVGILISGLRMAGVSEGAESAFPFERFEARVRVTADGRLTAVGTSDVGALRAGTLYDQGAKFIDVRSHDAFVLGHVPGAVNLPLASDFTRSALTRLVAVDRDVIFYCGSKYCGAAAIAAAKAATWGFEKVYRLSGGLPAWKEADCPLVVASRN